MSEFKSTYGQLMSVTGLSPRQEAALRDLDEIMVIAEHAMQGVPVGAGAHSTICALLMDAYAKGQRASEQAKRLTQAIRDAVTAYDESKDQWYVDEFTIDCDAEEFWRITEQALAEALR